MFGDWVRLVLETWRHNAGHSNFSDRCDIQMNECHTMAWYWHVILYVNILYIYTDLFNTLRPRQNGRHFADDIFKCIFLNENNWIPVKISLKFVPKGPINNTPALVEIMAWRRPGDKPLSEPIMVNLPTHICVTWPQWVKRKCHHFICMKLLSPDSPKVIWQHFCFKVIMSILNKNYSSQNIVGWD